MYWFFLKIGNIIIVTGGNHEEDNYNFKLDGHDGF